jgi:FlaA1/EpsC-like NDP-sugar epimerase
MRRVWHHPLRRLSMQLVGDSLLVGLAYFAAFYLRFNMEPPPAYMVMAWNTAPLIIGCTLAALISLRVYRMMWRYTSLADLVRLTQALTLGLIAAGVVMVLWTRLAGYPRTVFVITWAIAIFFLAGIRIFGRSLFERSGQSPEAGNEQRVILIGAGRAAEMLLTELRHHPEARYEVLGLLDDSPVKRGRLIMGKRVVGNVADLADLLPDLQPDSVVFCIPSAPNRLRQQVLAVCSDAGVPLQTLPRIADLVDGRITVSQIREITLEDLLGREAVALDEQTVARFVNGKSVLITGAGGSIGSEICRQVMRYGPARLVLFERSEFALFEIEGELRRAYPDARLVPILGDVQDRERLDEVFGEHHPAVLFHAAAYKHVPLVESNPYQALANNVGGSLTCARAAADAGVEHFVLISTDKAVNPTSFMGATKRVAERCCQAVGGGSTTCFTTVRFGNVIGSSGSVIPIFQRQIRSGGPITVTHRDIERYFMTIPEAAQLVLQASALSEGTETFILEMGQPVRIVDLARQMIRLSGLKEEDIEIVFTGLRPGEKLFEELTIDGEAHDHTAHRKILRVIRKDQDDQDLLEQVGELLVAGGRREEAAMRKAMHHLVDNYTPTTLPKGAE